MADVRALSGGYSPFNLNSVYKGGAALPYKIKYLQDIKAALDNNQMSVQDFLKYASPVAKDAYDEIGIRAAGGSRGASEVNPQQQVLKDIGFSQNTNGEIIPMLGPKYEQQLRDEKIPSNVSDIERTKLGEVPTDIPIGSDRFKIEQEAIRQEQQGLTGLNQRDVYRKKALGDLASLLATQRSQARDRAIPELSEQANLKGIFRSTGTGEAIARYDKQLAEDEANALMGQGIQNQGLYATGLGDITDTRLGQQDAALQRELSLQDFKMNKDFAGAMADRAASQGQRGKTRGEKWMQGANAAIGIGGIAAAPFTGGASLAATAGAGKAANKSMNSPKRTPYSDGGTYTA